MTRIEKQVIVVILVLGGVIGAGVAFTQHVIEEAGGINQIIIDMNEANKEEN